MRTNVLLDVPVCSQLPMMRTRMKTKVLLDVLACYQLPMPLSPGEWCWDLKHNEHVLYFLTVPTNNRACHQHRSTLFLCQIMLLSPPTAHGSPLTDNGPLIVLLKQCLNFQEFCFVRLLFLLIFLKIQRDPYTQYYQQFFLFLDMPSIDYLILALTVKHKTFVRFYYLAISTCFCHELYKPLNF
jgi:hypothetical protein